VYWNNLVQIPLATRHARTKYLKECAFSQGMKKDTCLTEQTVKDFLTNPEKRFF